jgi:hypothetical protein
MSLPHIAHGSELERILTDVEFGGFRITNNQYRRRRPLPPLQLFIRSNFFNAVISA